MGGYLAAPKEETTIMTSPWKINRLAGRVPRKTGLDNSGYQVTDSQYSAIVTIPERTDHSGARGDAQFIALWLGGKQSEHTRRAYSSDAEAFLLYISPRGLQSVTVTDLQGWKGTLRGAPATVSRRVKAIKSLLSFGQKTGYLAFNVGTAVDAPSVPNTLAERILSEPEVRAIVAAAAEGRDALMLRTLYATGARRSELCALCWEHVHPTPAGGATITLHGKGRKTRHVLVPEAIAMDLAAHRRGAGDGSPVFSTRSGLPVHPDNLAKMVRQAVKRSGVTRRATPHWFRHAHASHALDHGAPVSLVQASLGHESLATTGEYVHARPTDGAALYLPKI